MRIFISSKPENLASFLKAAELLMPGAFIATVEAEYGDIVVEGKDLTLAHHGPRAENPAPCLHPNRVDLLGQDIVCGVSHLDLDTLGGLMAIGAEAEGIAAKPLVEGFWELASFVDVNGAHKLGVSGASEQNLRRLYAFWAWSQNNRVFAPRDGSVGEITQEVIKASNALALILQDDAELLAAGDAFREAEGALNRESFVVITEKGIVIRTVNDDKFTNHLYVTPSGITGKAVIALNKARGSITVSLADPIDGVSCIKMLQDLWGPKAGGHAGIAGSPRERIMTPTDLPVVIRALEARL